MKASPDEYRFSDIGGRLCLDFVNSRNGSPENPEEHVHDYGDLLTFAAQKGYLGEIGPWRESAARSTHDATAVLGRALAFRSALRDVLTAATGGSAAPRRAVEIVDEEIRRARHHYRLMPTAHGFEETFAPSPGALDAVLAPVARSAAELLTSPDLQRVHVCESAACDWVFVDTSRNRSRRWCDMRDCGNRAKARKFYARKRKVRVDG